ncbi:putative phospholipase B-like 2 isoform X2 [Pogoniulus pusillus]|uniref:putative phospholipase B-like 2 isoform X2 n=1 Tax=Pogoniulus pusillus TaxID=488313 RepID=UPI0030B91DBC
MKSLRGVPAAMLRAVLVAALAAALSGAVRAAASSPPPSRNVSVLLEPGSERLRVLPGRHPAAVAWASLDDRIHTVGWAFLEVSTNASYNDSLQAYAAGLAEAAVSEQLMYMHWMNTMVGYCGPFKYHSEYCEKLRSYLEANLGWMEEQMGKGQDPEYWHQVHLALLQLKGLEDSYNRRLDFPQGRFTLSPFGFLLLQLGGDLEDLESALNRSSSHRVLGSGSCSALLKLLPGQQDLLVAHDTWTSYQSMLRIIKKYTLPFRVSASGSCGNHHREQQPSTVEVPGARGQCPGVAEEHRGQPAGPQRSRVGCHLPALQQRHVGGVAWYNNQWMVVDYKAFRPGRAEPPQGLLTVLEQIPGLVMVADQTELLYQQGYWASYNLPFYEEIFNASGTPELVKKYGDWFSYDKNPRAQIFRRNQTLVHDLDSMIRLMRSNNYLQDPLSRCRGCDPPQNAENAISARSDLNPANGTYPFPALRQRCHGGTDMKVTSSGMVPTFGLVAASGPAWDDVPPFRWSTSPCSTLLHMGHPDLWTFPPIKVHWG